MKKKELTNVLSSIYIFLGVKGKTKGKVLSNISRITKHIGLVNNEGALYSELIERERRASTTIGFGTAVPEASRIRGDHTYAFILCRLKEPVDFKSRYRRPVRIILLSLARPCCCLLPLLP